MSINIEGIVGDEALAKRESIFRKCLRGIDDRGGMVAPKNMAKYSYVLILSLTINGDIASMRIL